MLGRNLNDAPRALPSWDLNSAPSSCFPRGDDGVNATVGSGHSSCRCPGLVPHGGGPAGAAAGVVFEALLIETVEIEVVEIGNGWTWN